MLSSAWAALLLGTFALLSAEGCKIDEDCSLLGRCDAATSTCKCDAGWRGADCGELELLPAAPSSGYNLTAQGISTWGANIFPVHGSEDGDGDEWHMLASEFENKCGIDHWSPNSAIVHATSTSGAAGPYKRQSVAVIPFAHNPKVVRAPDGTWLMYTIGVQLPASDLFNCSQEAGSAIRGEYTDPAQSGRHYSGLDASTNLPPGRNPGNRESNVTLYTSATSLAGPWERYGVVLGPDFEGTWDEDTSNPSPWVFSNGTVLLMYRGCVVHGGGCDKEYIGIASAPSWKGPYRRLGGGQPILPTVPAEDPSLWVDRRGHYHFLMHYIPDAELVARHAFARSYGGPWSIRESSIPYNSTVAFNDGSVVTFEKRERPHLVWDDNGNPTHLVTGVVIPSGQHGYAGKSFTLVQPVAPSSSTAAVGGGTVP